MLLAGFGLEVAELKDNIFAIIKLTVLPIIVEVVSVAVLVHFLLGMPWIWGFLVGFVLTAISPNVVVTVLLSLKKRNLGTRSLHTIILAMTTFNNILAIFGFTVLLGVIFATGNIRNQILQGPVAVGIGLVFGGAFGFSLSVLPSNYAVSWLMVVP